MTYCNDCKAVVSTRYIETSPPRIGNGSENWVDSEGYDVCAECGSDDLTEDVPEEAE